MPGQTDGIYERFIDTESLCPKRTWVEATMRTITSNQPLQSTLKSLRFKLLASNFRDSLQAAENTCLPVNIHDMHNVALPGPLAMQLVDITDIGTSKMEQLERIELAEQGVTKKNLVITRIVEDEGVAEGSASQPSTARTVAKAADEKAKSNGPHKLLLEDAAGRRVYGIEMSKIEGVSTTMPMGSKFLLSNARVARGVLLIDPTNTKLLGGKIEDLNKEYIENRKATLKAAIEELKAANPRRK